MTWPLSQDYNEAIQDPANSFRDAELKTGEAVANALGIPMPRSGNFADVYEVRCPNGSRWAVKCFTRQVHGLAERYSEISKYLRLANLPFMVDFKYLEQGLRVRGQWYPILKMQWVEGFVLNEFVRDNLDKKPILQALGQIWLRMARRLRESYIAHCDLQHGNVMFVPGSTAKALAVKLIDYDGTCVPALLGSKSGEVGHPAYQHPERLRTGAYNQEVDRFSLLSIAAALRCLTIGGRALWEKYDNGDNLLFRQSDLQTPKESPLFQELLSIGDAQAQMLVQELYRACQGPLDAVPLVTDLLPEEKPAGKVTKTVAAVRGVAQQPAAEQGPDWDFADEGGGGTIVKKRRASKGIPLWAWAAMGVAAALLLSVGVGVGLLMRKAPAEKAGTPVAQSKPDTRKTPPIKEPSGDDPPSKSPKDQSLVPVRDDNKTSPPQPAPELAAGTGIFALVPGGDALALCEKGNSVWRLVEPKTKALIREFKGHTGAVVEIAFSPDGRLALTAGKDKMLRLWDVRTGQAINQCPTFCARVVRIALSADGKRVACADGSKTVHSWDFENKRGEGYRHSHEVSCLAFSPDGRYLFCGYDKGNPNNGGVLHRWDLKLGSAAPLYKHTAARVEGVVVSVDGKYLATAHAGEPGSVALWELESGKVLWSLGLSEPSCRRLAFSPDSRFLLVESGNGYRVLLAGPKVEMVDSRGRSVRRDLVSAVFTADSRGLMVAYGRGDRVVAGLRRMPSKFFDNSTDPQPSPAVGWDRPVDPDGDCQFRENGGKLTITAPKGKFHDLTVERGKMNAPRLLRDVEGDFTVEARVGGDFVDNGLQLPGLLLMVDDTTYLRLEKGRYAGRAQCLWELRQDGKQARGSCILSIGAAEGYLRLQRREGKLLGFHSDDGNKWMALKPFEIGLPRKVKVGVSVVAGAEGLAATFEQFQLQQGQGALARVDWPSLPAGETVVVKPAPKPPLPKQRRRDLRKPVPNAADIEAALKDIRDRHKGDPRDKLIPALFNEMNAARNDPPRHFALLREVRDLQCQDNVRGALSVNQQMAQSFTIDRLEMDCLVLEKATQGVRAIGEDILELGLPRLDRTVAEENYAVLGRLVKVLRINAGKSRDVAVVRMADRVLRRAENVKKEHAALQAERKTLADKPDHPKANLAVGKFHCVSRGDWQEGLPFLARGGDAALKEMAEKDLASPDDGEAQKALGDGWSRRAGSVNSTAARTAYQRRAHYWYQLAALQLPKESKVLPEVRDRMRALANAVPELKTPLSNLGIYQRGATIDSTTGAVHFRVNGTAATRQFYQGPIDVTVVARSMTTDLNVNVGKGGRLILGRDPFKKTDRLQVFRVSAHGSRLTSEQ
jgi:regulation of enolase protein 1 (concanavalin A-like superfamily)